MSAFEQLVVQNSVLGAEAIWQVAAECVRVTGRIKGVAFPLAFLILPICFHSRSSTCLSSKAQPGALQKALMADRALPAGLQDRMEAHAERTLSALNLSLSAGLLSYDRQLGQFFTSRATPPVAHDSDELSTMFSAARRLGQAFAELEVPQVSALLQVRF